jgi:hypothetical protein
MFVLKGAVAVGAVLPAHRGHSGGWIGGCECMTGLLCVCVCVLVCVLCVCRVSCHVMCVRSYESAGAVL